MQTHTHRFIMYICIYACIFVFALGNGMMMFLYFDYFLGLRSKQTDIEIGTDTGRPTKMKINNKYSDDF